MKEQETTEIRVIFNIQTPLEKKVHVYHISLAIKPSVQYGTGWMHGMWNIQYWIVIMAITILWLLTKPPSPLQYRGLLYLCVCVCINRVLHIHLNHTVNGARKRERLNCMPFWMKQLLAEVTKPNRTKPPLNRTELNAKTSTSIHLCAWCTT